MEQLFGSKTRVKLLKLFLSNPNRAFYVREITRRIDEQINSVRRELANLLNIGILTSREENNKLYYEVAQDYQLYAPLRAIFANAKVNTEGGVKTTDKDITAQLKELGSVEVLAYMGTFTNDTQTGIDILIVGDVNKTKAHNFVADLEDTEGRELKYVVMGGKEFRYRSDVNDRFVGIVKQVKKTVIHDPGGLLSDNK